MARTYLVRDFMRDLDNLLKDPGFVRWSQAERVSYVNAGQMAIAKFVPIAASRTDAVKLRPGSRQSISLIAAADVIPGDGSDAADVRGLFLQDIAYNLGADGQTPGAAISIIPRDEMDGFSLTWRQERGDTEIQHYIYDPQQPLYFETYPPVAAAGTWVEMAYVAAPDDIPAPDPDAVPAIDYAPDGASTQVLGIQDRWRDDLLNYTLARCWMKDAEDAANAANVQLFSGLFVNSINAQVQVLTGHNPNLKNLPFAPNMPAAAS